MPCKQPLTRGRRFMVLLSLCAGHMCTNDRSLAALAVQDAIREASSRFCSIADRANPRHSCHGLE